MKRIIWTVVITLLVIIAIPALILASGAINMAATSEPSGFEKAVAAFAVQRSMAWRAPDQSAVTDDKEAVSHGLSHYGSMCVRCHGGPGVQPEDFALGLNPPAPALEKHLNDFTDEEIFWIIKHGIRMTGMPAFGRDHSDQDIWNMVAFLRAMPSLTAEQKQRLNESVGEQHEHGTSSQPKPSARRHGDGDAVKEKEEHSH